MRFFTVFLLFITMAYATQRVSVDDSTILLANGHSFSPALSRDGRFVAFVSDSTSLSANDTNDADDIFIADRQNGTIQRAWVSGVNNFHIKNNSDISITNDGRYIVFVSTADLLPIDDNTKSDVYLYDNTLHTLTCVSVNSDGVVGNEFSFEASISASGNHIIFMSHATNLMASQSASPGTTTVGNIFLYDMSYGYVIWNVSEGTNGHGGNNGCRYPRITEDGRYIVFQSLASDLVSGDTNDKRDFFIRGTRNGDSTIRIDARYNDISMIPSNSSISDDGRYLVFASELDTLVANDTNEQTDIFIWDRDDGSFARIAENGHDAYISGDGNYVSYYRVISGDRRIFRYNRSTGVESEVSVNSAGTLLNNDSRGASMSRNGNLIAFTTQASNVTPLDTNAKLDIVLHNYNNSSTQIVSGHTPRSNASSGAETSLSGSGQYVVFESTASNLVPNDTNEKKDIFLRDTKNNTIEILSIATDGTQGNYDAKNPSMSADGKYVVFESFSNNLISGDINEKKDIFIRNRQTNTTTRISKKRDGSQSDNHSFSAKISADGKFVVFKSFAALDDTLDLNTKSDIYMYSVQSGEIKLISLSDDNSVGNGVSYSPSISSHGEYVVFASTATNFSALTTAGNRTNIFLRDIQNATTTLLISAEDGSEADANCVAPSISADAKFIAFESSATNLVTAADTNGFNDIFLYNRISGNTERVTNATGGGLANNHSYLSYGSSISKNGRFVTFRSGANNLVPNDTNGEYDAFIYDAKDKSIHRVSVSDSGEQANGTSYAPSISADGSVVAYLSTSKNLVSGDNNNKSDVFMSENEHYSGGGSNPALIMYLLN